MKILLVEDQPDKREQIEEFISEKLKEARISHAESLRGALNKILQSKEYNLILLDMSMPNFDASIDASISSSAESFAGRELLEQMKLRNIKIPVIVITQYSSFEGGAVTLEALSKEFSLVYKEFYIGHVYFNSAIDTWKTQLSSLLMRHING